MSFAEAATIPMAWTTVHYGLDGLAQLEPGETLLVHSAAGGVGLAAIELARQRGAKVIATAGSGLKRDYLRAQGIEHVLDSRSTRFADEVMAITGGRGVDVVLNSLNGESLARSLEAVAPGGRFVEIGKRDILSNARLAMRPLANNISLYVIDLLSLHWQKRRVALRNIHEVYDAVRAGQIRALPHRVYPAARIHEAFRLIQRSRHIGKIVVSFDEPVAVERRPRRLALDPDGSYLVVGGLGGLGAETAIRLAERGARHLVLLGRRGMRSPEAQRVVDELAERGAQADVRAVDITDRAAVRAVLDTLGSGAPPLRGVVHAAMALDDRPFAELDDAAFHTALDPKLVGAQHLDELTRHAHLEFFVVYSSFSALWGGIKQANYNAGNGFLEAIVRKRRGAGLPGLAVQWGALSDAGYVAREGIAHQLAAMGLIPFPASSALDVLEDLILDPSADVVAVGQIDREAGGTVMPQMFTPRLADFAPMARSREDALASLLGGINAVPEEEALRLVTDAVLAELAGVMQTTPDRIDPDKKLDELGVDSLMAMDLVGALRRSFGFQQSTTQLMLAAGSVLTLAEDVHRHLKTVGVAK
jgi:NADPH:quinone reductase-like Zn-dependent oxidoreductase/acyl carrier protein